MGTRLARRLAIASALIVLALGVGATQAQAFSKAIWVDGSVPEQQQFPIFTQLGVGIVEQQLPWSFIATQRPAQPTDPNDPAYDWPADIQQTIDLAQAYHMKVLLQIIGTPPWANGGQPEAWTPTNPTDYANFAAAAARKYPSVHLWMVWGEPNRAHNYQPMYPSHWWEKKLTASQQIAPHNYARLLDAAYGALKQVSHANLVIGGNTYSGAGIWPVQWVENLRLPNGRPPRMDMYGQNPFTWGMPTFAKRPSQYGGQVLAAGEFPDLPFFAQTIDHYLHRGLPLFLSEYTLPTHADEEFNFAVKQKVAAKWTAEALYESRRWKRIYAFGWIHVYDDPPFSYGGLLTANGTPKADFWAFKRG